MVFNQQLFHKTLFFYFFFSTNGGVEATAPTAAYTQKIIAAKRRKTRMRTVVAMPAILSGWHMLLMLAMITSTMIVTAVRIAQCVAIFFLRLSL